MNYKDTTVIIPTLNEEKNISKIIDLIKKQYKGINIIVSDDGSKDNTQKIVEKTKHVTLLDRSNKKTKGLTASVIDAAKITNTKYIVVIDADLQHPVKTIKDIRKKLENCHIVIATRKKTENWPLTRKIISRAAILLGQIRLMLNLVFVEDPVSGFFGIRTDLMKNTLRRKEEKFEKTGYKILFDTLKYSKKAKIAEVYYNFKTREHGSSKIGKKQIISYLKSLFK